MPGPAVLVLPALWKAILAGGAALAGGYTIKEGLKDAEFSKPGISELDLFKTTQKANKLIRDAERAEAINEAKKALYEKAQRNYPGFSPEAGAGMLNTFANDATIVRPNMGIDAVPTVTATDLVVPMGLSTLALDRLYGNKWQDWETSSTLGNYDVDYVTGDVPAPKGDDNDKKGDNNNNNNKNKNNFPWGTALTVLGLAGYTGYLAYQGHKEREEQKENEEVAKKNEQSAAQLGVTAGKGVFKRDGGVKNDSVPSTSTSTTPGYNSTSSGKPNKPNKPKTTKFNSDSAYTNKNYANDDW